MKVLVPTIKKPNNLPQIDIYVEVGNQYIPLEHDFSEDELDFGNNAKVSEEDAFEEDDS